MKKLMTIGLFLLFIVSMGQMVSGEPMKLKFATMDPAQATPVVNAYKPWLERINNASQGTLQIEVYPGGTLGRDPRIQYKLVQDGVADMAFIVPAYTPGMFKDDEVFGLPFTADNGIEAAIASDRLVKKGIVGGYDDVHLVAHYTSGVYYLHSTFPARLPSDLKGHKLRALNKIQSDMLDLVGASGIGIPGPQLAESLSRGTIEGVFCDNSSMFTFRVADVTYHHLLVPVGVTALAVVMNKAVYQSLPPAAKSALDKYGEDIVEMFPKAIEEEIDIGIAKLKADPKYSIVQPTPQELAVWKKTLQPVIDGWVGNDPRNEKLLNAYLHELELVRSGK